MMSSYTYSLILKTILMVFLLEARPTSSANPVALHGLNYNTRKGPDWDPDRCKQSYEILNDLTLLSRMTKRFRLLSLTDCNQGAMVLEVAQQLDLTLWLGLWVGLPPENADEESAFEKDFKELQRLIEEEPDVLRNHVIGVSVGSEALYREDATLADMIDNFNAGTSLELLYDSDIVALALLHKIYDDFLSFSLSPRFGDTCPHATPLQSGIYYEIPVSTYLLQSVILHPNMPRVLSFVILSTSR